MTYRPGGWPAGFRANARAALETAGFGAGGMSASLADVEWDGSMRALLVSTYDLGRQPFGLASPAAWLRAAGWDVVCVDLAKEPWDDERLGGVALAGFHLPMH